MQLQSPRVCFFRFFFFKVKWPSKPSLRSQKFLELRLLLFRCTTATARIALRPEELFRAGKRPPAAEQRSLASAPSLPPTSSPPPQLPAARTSRFTLPTSRAPLQTQQKHDSHRLRLEASSPKLRSPCLRLSELVGRGGNDY